jgi:hypothetical protein
VGDYDVGGDPCRVFERKTASDFLSSLAQGRLFAQLAELRMTSFAIDRRKLPMRLKTQAATEIARFLAHHPTPEQIVAFHPSPEVAERAYELIRAERDDSLTDEERGELESYLLIEYLMELVKFEAHQQLRQQAS